MRHPGILLCLVLLAALTCQAKRDDRPDPTIAIPYCRTAPVLDGKLGEHEYDMAAAIGMLEAYPSYWPQVMRAEQATYYVCWDDKYLYVCMHSLEGSTNRIMARCTQNDKMGIIGDDCMEVMVSPGDAEAIKDPDFPTYYFAANSIGTLWDAMFKPQRAEMHNSWQSGAEVAHSVDGTRWVAEFRIPLAAVAVKPPTAGTVWRMNFDRTYYPYTWSAWNASGGLNDARVGGNVTFTRDLPAIRVISAEDLIAAKLRVTLEVANPTDTEQTVTLKLAATGVDQQGDTPEPVGSAEQTVAVPPGKVVEVLLGKQQRLRNYNTVTLAATAANGQDLFSLERDVWIPVPRIPPKVAPDLPLVYVFPRFLPSRERLVVEMDATAWLKRSDAEAGNFAATVTVTAKDAPDKPVIEGTCTDFAKGKGVARFSTKDLPEGDYVVKVAVNEGGKEIAVHDDWFEKKIFDWMVHPAGLTDEAPAPYTPLAAKGASVRPWGRDYQFAPNGLPAACISQDKPLLSGPVVVEATIGGKPATPKVTAPYAVGKTTSAVVEGSAAFALNDVAVTVASNTEYDGLTRYRMTLAPTGKTATVDRLRLRVPLTGKYCRFYSASGNREGTSIHGAVLPAEPGEFYNSKTDTYAVGGYPTWSMLLWIADYDSYFCYAADNPKGWAVSDDRPAVTAAREGNDVVMYLNLIDRQIELTGPRTLEFAFQAGPTKPLPDGWRGIQWDGDPKAAPQTIGMVPGGGGGYVMYGSPWFIHPGFDPETIEKSRQRIADFAASGPYLPVGYQRWPLAIKGHPASRVFRGEWGIDKAAWDRGAQLGKYYWERREFGDNKDTYYSWIVEATPSYVDWLIHAYDRALTETLLYGTYDDTGYPVAGYDPELGIGYISDEGREVPSTGLWLYRQRWQRAAVVNAKHHRLNLTMDSQHVQAHYQPAYGFIGVWAPCEKGYYNHHEDRDNIDFYGSLERYYAYNPSYAFGQLGCAIGLGSPQNTFAPLASDTRSMMFLTLLHDQDVGTFGHRDMRTVYRLREARDVFRQWEKDVSFVGYWAENHPVAGDRPDVKISLYRRPGSALLFVGNLGDATTVRLTPDWKALGIDAAKATAGDPETGAPIAVANGTIALDLAHHQLQLVLVGDLGGYQWQPGDPGRDLPKPATVIAELSDPLRSPTLDQAWTVDVHEGAGNVGFVDGRTYVQATHYGWGHIRRPLGVDNVSVQCLIMAQRSGSADHFFGGLGLWWDNGSYVRIIPGGSRNKFLYEATGQRPANGSDIRTEPADRWYPYLANGVKIRLTPEKILFFVSTDGKTWQQDHELARTGDFAGAPAWAILGNGGAQGDKPFFKNILAQHYVPQRAWRITVVSDFVVGKE